MILLHFEKIWNDGFLPKRFIYEMTPRKFFNELSMLVIDLNLPGNPDKLYTSSDEAPAEEVKEFPREPGEARHVCFVLKTPLLKIFRH